MDKKENPSKYKIKEVSSHHETEKSMFLIIKNLIFKKQKRISFFLRFQTRKNSSSLEKNPP